MTAGRAPRSSVLRALFAGLLLVLAAACDGPDIAGQVAGKWEMTNPGGDLLGGRIEFHPSGAVYVVEEWRNANGGRDFVTLSGQWEMIDDLRLRMDLAPPDGESVTRVVGVAVSETRLSLGYSGGSVVFRRVDN